jgi:hypothetical protein
VTDALFVDSAGIYPQLLGAEHCWDITRDARTYAGPGPVVAHPPCNLWVNMAAVNYTRALREHARGVTNRKITLPAWYQGGTDEGCFACALTTVRRCGGVLEHPAGSHAWSLYGLTNPNSEYAGDPDVGWCERDGAPNTYVCEVWQSAYGHAARKRTWLLYVGTCPPFELNWGREPGTHQVGWFDRNKPTLNKKAASATPVAFAEALIELAEWSR